MHPPPLTSPKIIKDGLDFTPSLGLGGLGVGADRATAASPEEAGPPTSRRPQDPRRHSLGAVLWSPLERPAQGVQQPFFLPPPTPGVAGAKGYGSISGSPSLVPWTGKVSWIGVRLS
jgi:hypothetical protein